MLKLSVNLFNIPILSLRTGGQIGVALQPILNPNNLKIEGWHAQSAYTKSLRVLPAIEIREFTRIGIAVNDHEALTDPKELIRMKKILDIDYQLIGKSVVTKNKRHLGKVEDFASDLDSFYVQRLYVKPRALQALTKDSLTIARQQIIEITDRKIIVKDMELTEKAFFKAPARVQQDEAPA